MHFKQLTVFNNIFYLIEIVRQTGPPKILFKKRHFIIGENLIANCTTAKSYPQSHITWLINGKKVGSVFPQSLSISLNF